VGVPISTVQMGLGTGPTFAYQCGERDTSSFFLDAGGGALSLCGKVVACMIFVTTTATTAVPRNNYTTSGMFHEPN